MKALFGLLLALVLSIPGGEALAQITDLNSAINKAGRQRMLSQRMAKAYFQIGQQVEVDRSKKVLDASVALFDRQLVELKNFAPTPEIKDNYLKLEKSWLEFKDLLVGAQPSQDNGRKVLDLSEQVLSLAHQGTVQLEKQSASSAGRLVNVSGRQRMLSQRMAKAYFQIGQGVDVERSKKILDTSVATFDRQLVELKNYAPTPDIKNTYLSLEKTWLSYKDVLIGKAPSPDNGRKVLALSEDVLVLAQQGTVQLEKQSTSAAGPLVNVSGRQRMLSQRMAKFYQASAWGVGDASSTASLEGARKEFNEALGMLAAAPANTPQIKDSLELVKQQWFFFENALGQKTGGDKRPQTAVATTSERILEEMEGVVGLYEKLPK